MAEHDVTASNPWPASVPSDEAGADDDDIADESTGEGAVLASVFEGPLEVAFPTFRACVPLEEHAVTNVNSVITMHMVISLRVNITPLALQADARRVLTRI